MRGFRGTGLALVAAPVALVVPQSAHADLTIGSNLNRAPDAFLSCGGMVCTARNATLPASSQAPGGLISPVNGTLVRWRVRVGADTDAAALRVMRPGAAGTFAGAGTSPTVPAPTVNAISTFEAQLPIAIGDSIGLNCCQDDTQLLIGNAGALSVWTNPVLADGGPARPPVLEDAFELAFNADIEPTSSFTVKAAKATRGGRVLIRATLPNPGSLAARDKADRKGAGAAAKKGKPKRLLRRAKTKVTAPGGATLVVRPTKRARQKLSQGARVRAKLRLAFTPTGGAPATRRIRVKLKP